VAKELEEFKKGVVLNVSSWASRSESPLGTGIIVDVLFIFLLMKILSIAVAEVIDTLQYRYPCYRPWRPIGLREVKAPTLLRQTANTWRQGCQPYALAALYPQVSLFSKIPGTHFC
jgi:hypothetical protein